ncbi:MAG TPA: hypothetical protein VMU30_00955 [Bacteroidota bacterium]|nr:hypothetical protein [Bacteroidota bacterium]
MKSIILCMGLWSISAFSQEITFYKEDITITFDHATLLVDGYYWFINHAQAEKTTEIYYPFGITSPHEQVDSVTVTNISQNYSPLLQNQSNKGVMFLLDLPAGDTTVYHITYRQTVLSDSARYILTSTQQWHQPLAHAEYKLILNEQTVLKDLSYSPDKTYHIGNQNIYYWKQDQFMPSRDIVFHFKNNP